MDLLKGFPRAVWSEANLDILRWVLHRMRVNGIPSTKASARAQKVLASALGANTTLVWGSMSNVFSVNSLEKILQNVC